MNKLFKIAAATSFFAIASLSGEASAKNNCPTGYDKSACETWKRQNKAPQSYFGGGSAADSCAAILADDPQAVVLRDASGADVTSWRASNINWAKSKRFSKMMGRDVYVGMVCGDSSKFAQAGPGGTFCGKIERSEMSASENRRLAKGTIWSKNDPFCIMSQKDCRKVGMSWK